MRLYLLRHAHARGGTHATPDASRPLTARGRREAEGVRAYLASRDAPPARVLCSSARRAVETMQLAVAGLSPSPEVSVLDDLYLASAWKLFERVRAIEATDVAPVLVVAHNPGVAELAESLAERGDPAALRSLGTRFLPATLAEIELPGDHYADLAPAAGTLVGLRLA